MSVHANIEFLDWESAFFGLPSAKLQFSEQATALCADALHAYAVTQAKIPADRLELADKLADLGFRLVEGEVDLAMPVPAITLADSASAAACYRLAGEADIPALQEGARAAFALSRFRAPWYQPEDSGRFYARWVENGVRGSFDHACLVIEQQGVIEGFVTLRDLGQQQARIGLLAAMPACSGRGVGQQLMLAAQYWCLARGIHTLRIATQVGNLAALRLYIRSGATIVDTAYWFYR